MTSNYRKFLLASALAGAVVLPAGTLSAQAVVQAVPPREIGDLQSALAALARNPSDLEALIRAGEASISLDDLDAALGFFRRAQAISPNNARIEAGLAAITLRQGDAVEAVRLFEQAQSHGMARSSHAGDHGLALDLVGDNLGAQRLYREALQAGENAEISRRLALSLAISGDQRGSEATLLPLLQRTDLAAYRTRAFALAILGKSDEAVSIAETMLPQRLSNRMAPYLRYMPRLTRAQQAAAANLGRFPPASEIGRDAPDIAAYSARSAPQVASRSPYARLEPAGEPLGARPEATRRRNDRNASSRKSRDTERVVVGRVVAQSSTPIEQVAAAQIPPAPVPAPSPSPSPAPAPAPIPSPAPQQAAPQPVLVASAEAEPAQPQRPSPRPSFSITEPEVAPQQGAGQPDVEPAETSPPISLAEAFAAFSSPPEDAAEPKTGAVDITAIEPPREKPEPPPKPKPPAHPKRYWVQVATGRDAKALAFDWRRIKREGGELLKSSDAFTASWGQTNRLVTGPYDSATAAQKAVGALKAEGLDTFAFTSAEGEEVRPLK